MMNWIQISEKPPEFPCLLARYGKISSTWRTSEPLDCPEDDPRFSLYTHWMPFIPPSPEPELSEEGHVGDCTIYSALVNGNPTDGICTCGCGFRFKGDERYFSATFSEERLKAMKPQFSEGMKAFKEWHLKELGYAANRDTIHNAFKERAWHAALQWASERCRAIAKMHSNPDLADCWIQAAELIKP